MAANGRAIRNLFLTVLVLLGSACAGNFEDGLEAYKRGDYATALSKFKPLAEQGDAKAQNQSGAMYATGRGVPKDMVQAYMWFSIADVQGFEKSSGQINLIEKAVTSEQIAEAQRRARE